MPSECPDAKAAVPCGMVEDGKWLYRKDWKDFCTEGKEKTGNYGKMTPSFPVFGSDRRTGRTGKARMRRNYGTREQDSSQEIFREDFPQR